ncbi:AraC family transcriptional regulator N-terminal domain-containing protein [Bacillus sp. 179-C3.3 HS]|uniref:AraC family transcriptional regulator n=1 Tax=Bacillus sp. 179-C3.3 HS TaxID=3232162 RepID=UPI0039A390C9
MKNDDAHLKDIIEQFTSEDGVHPTLVPSLFFIRESTTSERIARVNEASFCMILQGEKKVWLGDEAFQYGPNQYIVASIDLPVIGQVIQASSSAPYLALKIEFSSAELIEVYQEMKEKISDQTGVKRAMFTSESQPLLKEAVSRYVGLLQTPTHIPVLAPLYKKEILYWILNGENGMALTQMMIEGSHASRISHIIDHITAHYHKRLRVQDLAQMANMSVPTMHRHFRAFTGMSPIQFQKQLKLNEGKRLLMTETSDVASVAYQIGYESPSQFSREYRRMFGLSPKADMDQFLKNSSY